MRAARSPDRTQTTAGAISHRRPDRTYSTPSWCEPDRRPSARPIRRSGRHRRQQPHVTERAEPAPVDLPYNAGSRARAQPRLTRIDATHRVRAGVASSRKSPLRHALVPQVAVPGRGRPEDKAGALRGTRRQPHVPHRWTSRRPEHRRCCVGLRRVLGSGGCEPVVRLSAAPSGSGKSPTTARSCCRQ